MKTILSKNNVKVFTPKICMCEFCSLKNHIKRERQHEQCCTTNYAHLSAVR